jgi:predicted CxxxxCH...CXXCH cytochrome family protein
MCHGDVRKTSNCDACHSTATTIPFKSMAGATAVSDSKVGAHVKHLGASAQAPVYSANIACSECHAVPGSPAVSGTHRNGTTDIVFGTLAKTGSLTPVYTTATGVCAATYCHGNTLDKPATAVLSPTWNAPFLTGVAASDCAKCHGYPPATATHAGKTPTQCSGCHPHLNSTGTGFVDVSKHINGLIDASGGGHAFPNPGSSHKGASNGSGCLGCHTLGTSASVYPVTAGTAPSCRACHLTANPGIDPHCSDCHGSVTNNGAGSFLAGRPVGGTAFPNRPGQHNRSEHVGRACTVCHPFTSGDSRHGWSNRQKSTAAQVGGAGTNITSWNAATKSCTPTCHGRETW